MIKIYKILFFAVILVFSGSMCFSQAVTTVPSDTGMSVQKRTGSNEDLQNQVQSRTQSQSRKQEAGQGQGTGQNAGAKANANAGAKGAGTVKQVKSARPDWSKAKGARPNIVRPSGSAIPKGAGKPGGAGRPGGR